MPERRECEECWTPDTLGGWGHAPDRGRIWICLACMGDMDHELGLVRA